MNILSKFRIQKSGVRIQEKESNGFSF